MESLDPYRQFAKYYDAYVQGFAFDIPLYLSCCAGRRRIVEIGCGTGRVLKPLLETGHQVLGVDVSAEMLEIAREKLRPQVESGALRLANHNFAEARVEKRFDCALVTFFTFNYLLDEKVQQAFLRNVAQSLKPEALFVADLFFPHPLAHPEQAGIWRERHLQVDGKPLLMRDRRGMAGITERREQVYLTETGEESVTTLRRFVAKQEMNMLLDEAGFRKVQFVDGYDADSAHTLRVGEETIGSYCALAEKS